MRALIAVFVFAISAWSCPAKAEGKPLELHGLDFLPQEVRVSALAAYHDSCEMITRREIAIDQTCSVIWRDVAGAVLTDSQDRWTAMFKAKDGAIWHGFCRYDRIEDRSMCMLSQGRLSFAVYEGSNLVIADWGGQPFPGEENVYRVDDNEPHYMGREASSSEHDLFFLECLLGEKLATRLRGPGRYDTKDAAFDVRGLRYIMALFYGFRLSFIAAKH